MAKLPYVNITLLPAVVVLALLTLPSQTLCDDKPGDVFIYRPSAFTSWGRNYIAEVDGIAVAELSSCSYVRLKVSPGSHVFRITLKPWVGDKEYTKVPLELTTEIKPNQKYYLGCYSFDMYNDDLKNTFISFIGRTGNHSPHFGLAHPERASRDMLNCSELKSTYE